MGGLKILLYILEKDPFTSVIYLSDLILFRNFLYDWCFNNSIIELINIFVPVMHVKFWIDPIFISYRSKILSILIYI